MIRVRHKRGCPRAANKTARCQCKPSYSAEVFLGERPSSTTGKLINAYERKTFPTRKAAEAWEREFRAKRDRDPTYDAGRVKQPFAQLTEQWLLVKKPALAPRSYDRAEQIINKHLLPVFGPMPVGSITFEVWRDHLAKLAGQTKPNGRPLYAAGTLNRIHGVMTNVMEEARVRGILTANPCRRAGKNVIPKAERKMTFLTAAEIMKLADAITPHYRAMVLTAGFTGLRAGELAALQRQDIEFDLARQGDQLVVTGGSLTVARAVKAWHGGQPIIGTTKTNKVRVVSLSPELAEVLRAHLATRPAAPGTLVFTNPKGDPVHHVSFARTHFMRAKKKAVPDKPTLRWHDLRHSFISLLLAGGVDVLEVAGQAGHASAAMTLNVYGHRMPSGRDKVRQALSLAWADAEQPAVVPLRVAEG